MTDLCVIVPTRGRPQAIVELLAAWQETGADARLEVVVDADDPELERYEFLVTRLAASGVGMTVGPRIRLGPTLNREARIWAEHYRYLGFLGDDHRPRTPEWDRRICLTLERLRTGIAYGNDLMQYEALPTAVFMTSDIVKTLGYMCPPELTHMFLDNSWKAWGEGMGRLRYLPDVVIEHVHPHAGKGENDGSYDEAWQQMGPDGERYEQYVRSGRLEGDVAKLRDLCR